ncbi:MAG: hypothetical protein IMW99_07475 [Firmicutes bacterium]|nr:hypothetical protein [Bacillota bacterium]
MRKSLSVPVLTLLVAVFLISATAMGATVNTGGTLRVVGGVWGSHANNMHPFAPQHLPPTLSTPAACPPCRSTSGPRSRIRPGAEQSLVYGWDDEA